jgi:hypothetical protein
VLLPKTPAIFDDEARARHPGYDRMPLRAVNELLKLGREVERGLGTVQAPVQLIYSRRDPTVPQHNAERILRALPPGDRELHWLKDSAHARSTGSATGSRRPGGRVLRRLEKAEAVDGSVRALNLGTRTTNGSGARSTWRFRGRGQAAAREARW